VKEERKPYSEKKKANEENKVRKKGRESKINSKREKKRKKGVRGIEYLYSASIKSYIY